MFAAAVVAVVSVQPAQRCQLASRRVRVLHQPRVLAPAAGSVAGDVTAFVPSIRDVTVERARDGVPVGHDFALVTGHEALTRLHGEEELVVAPAASAVVVEPQSVAVVCVQHSLGVKNYEAKLNGNDIKSCF